MIERPIRSREVRQILEIEDSALANLWITQAYHDLATGLAPLLGRADASWCSFAVWASKTAGRSIRADRLVDRLRHLFRTSSRFQFAISRSNSILNPSRWLGLRPAVDFDALFAGLSEVAKRVSESIASGNRRVFSELGPIFAHMIETFEGATERDPEALEELLKTHVDPIDRAGDLRRAVSDYYAAIFEPKPQRRAQLILLANSRAVLHEQRELQADIARALDAPVDHILEHLSYGPWLRGLPVWVQTLLDFARRFVERETRGLWEEFMTEVVMTIQTADEVLALGSDVPPLPSGQLFPDALATPEGALADFLATWDRTGGTGVGSGADDWEQLDQRMNYIANLFRSRQQHAPLLAAPYTASVLAEMASGRVPENV